MQPQMKVTLLENSSLYLAARACRMSHDNHDKSDTCTHEDLTLDIGDASGTIHVACTVCGTKDTHIIECGPKDRALIERVGNKLKHASILEQLVYTFDIDAISRACLQELARHRTARLTVKSSRYTLKELKNEPPFLNGWSIIDSFEDTDFADDGYNRAARFLVFTDDFRVDLTAIGTLDNVIALLNEGIPNDKVKYTLPESYKTRLQWQIDGRNLQNFFALRNSPEALEEIRLLANALYDELPDSHKYLYISFGFEE